MRRKDREITDKNEILYMIRKCDVCRIAFYDNKFPYIIPMNFGVTFENDRFILYFHGANVGHKLELMSVNPNVAFEMDCEHKLLLGDKACNATMEYESVCGNGIIEIVEENEKNMALIHLMNQYSKDVKHEFSEKELRAVVVLKLAVNEITGKRLKR